MALLISKGFLKKGGTVQRSLQRSGEQEGSWGCGKSSATARQDFCTIR